MEALRYLSLALWLALLAYMVPGAWGASFGSANRRGDPMRLGVLATAIVMIGFKLRGLLAPDSELAWALLQILSALDAIFIALLAKAYGRGRNVS